jgi:O-succinylbenzoic acid--CoA ligase
MRVSSWLLRAAAARPRHVALETSAGRLTYEELARAALARAQWLTGDLGLAPGDRVAIALPPGARFVQALHACLLAGVVAVPVDARFGESERAAIIAGCAHVIDDADAPAPRSRQLTAAGHDLQAPALLIHTSGTTATPKPVTVTYGNLLWSALGSAVALGRDPADRWLSALPLSHIGGLSIVVRSAIYGTTAIVHEGFDTERALRAIETEDVTLVSVVATTLARLLDAGLRRPPRLRCALAGGGPVPPALLERAAAAGVAVSQTYGLSEAASQVTTVPVAAPPHERDAAAGAGPPLFCTRVEVGDDDEILVRGPTVAAGAARADGWLHTGDLGRLDAHGRLHVIGRKADTIVTGGENVAPAEIEAVLCAHPAIAEAAVLGRPDARWGEAVIALVIARDGEERPSEAELRAHCAACLAGYKVPKDFQWREEPFPRTSSGKLLRRELRG